MQKRWITLLMLLSLFQVTIAMNDYFFDLNLQAQCKYLQRIQALKHAHEIPVIVIKSILNSTKYDVAIVNEFTYESCIIPAGQQVEVADFMKKMQRQLSRKDRLDGLCDQFSFYMTLLETSGYLSTEKGGYCHINFFVDLHDDGKQFAMQSIDNMLVKFHIDYFNGCAGQHELQVVNDQSDAFEITLKIVEVEIVGCPEDMQFTTPLFFYFLKSYENEA